MTQPPQVSCDLCEAPMTLPPGAVRHGKIIGLLVCTQCTEDATLVMEDLIYAHHQEATL